MSRSSLERASRRGGVSFLAQKIDEKNRMKESISHHKTGLPQSLLHLFEARPMPPFKDPMRKKKPTLPITGVGEYLEHLGDPETEEHRPPPPPNAPPEPRAFINPELALQVSTNAPTRLERAAGAARAAQEHAAAAAKESAGGWDPSKDPNVEGDPFKTLFVARLSYDVSERKLRREFEEFGPIRRIRLVHDKQSGKPRGYAFIEFEHKSDMKDAYKASDGRRIEGKRCLVDVERGRTVPGWKPRRLGGGKGGELRAARLPKDPTRQTLRRHVDRLLGVEDEPIAGEPPRGADDRALEDGRTGRDDGRDRDRDDRHRDRDRRRELEYDRERDRGRERDRDRRETRKRERVHEQARDMGGGMAVTTMLQCHHQAGHLPDRHMTAVERMTSRKKGNL